jgi:REP element-mobilizing transposase RayT
MKNPFPLEFGKFYHIYNRGNNGENIFIQQRNYDYFMELWWKHIYPIADTCAYCLLKNHFHAAVYVRERKDVVGKVKEPGQYFSNFFNAYARAVNLATQRTGALFERPFKRIEVDTEDYLRRLIVYIHQNPQKHGFVDDYRGWPYSSYLAFLDTSPTRLKRETIINLFGGKEVFVKIHDQTQVHIDFEDHD